VGLAGASIGGRGAVPLGHGAGLPAGDAHEINLSATLGEPLVGEGVPELVRVQSRETRLGAAPLSTDVWNRAWWRCGTGELLLDAVLWCGHCVIGSGENRSHGADSPGCDDCLGDADGTA
jgi:hypothetical protein